MSESEVRVIRILEYRGHRWRVEQEIKNSIHGTKNFGGGTITAATLGEYPEIITAEVYEPSIEEQLEAMVANESEN